MKHIKNKRAFATGIISTIVALICIGVIMVQGFQPRFVISLIILIAWSMVSYFTAFTQKGVLSKRLNMLMNGIVISLSVVATRHY